MTPEQWREIKAILQGALDLDPADRRAYLESQTPDVACEVESLLGAYEKDSAFLETPAFCNFPSSLAAPAEFSGKRFGPYRVLSLLGEGGMGSVWLAERVDGLFTRQVALKLVHPVLMGRVMTERVARERGILASLNHPNIARLFDAGFAQDGQPYLALEYIRGTPLTVYCDEHRLSIRGRLEMFRQVLGAVQYAHAHLVIHRDLKPSNILVSEGGQVHLLDFGIAKLVTEGEAKETELTQLGGRALTPDYAAPEQITGAPITTAADIYALGVMLYELLTGARPYRLKRDSRGALEEAILTAEPMTPSRLSIGAPTAKARGTTPKKLMRALKGDLDTITHKALKKSPSDRYATANALGEDIGRFLNGEVVLAQRDSVAYRAVKFMRRHRVAIAVVAALIVTLAGGFAATIYEAAVASSQRDAAFQAQLRSLTQTAAARLANADVPAALGIILEVLSVRGTQPSYTPEALSVFQEGRAADLQIQVVAAHEDVAQTAAFAPDGRSFVTASDDGTAAVWSTATGQRITLLSGHKGRVFRAAFSPNGTRIVTASSDKSARIWDAATGRQMMVLNGHTAGVWSATFSPDGGRIVTASSDKTARIWDATTGAQMALLNGHTDRVWCAAFSPDGTRIVTASFDKTARIWDAVAGREIMLLRGHKDLVASAAFSPDGRNVITASLDKSARIWDAATGQQIMLLSGHTDRVMSARYSPDGGRIVTASLDKTARVWDAVTGQQTMLLSGHSARVNYAEFSTDGGEIITSSYDGFIRLWDAVPSEAILQLSGHTDRVWSAAFSPDGAHIVTSSFDSTARIWDAVTGREILVLRGHTNAVPSARYSPDGRRIVTASNDNTARIWDAATGRQMLVLTCPTRVWSAAFSPDGQRVITACDDKTASVWDAATGRKLLVLIGHTGRVLSAAFSHDSKRIVTASVDKTARMWDTATGQEIMQLRGHADVVESAGFSPDDGSIVTGSDDKTARIWNTATGREIMLLSGHSDVVSSAAFSPDGRHVVTSSYDKTARVWDAANGLQILVLSGHVDLLESAGFSADGTRIVTASDDGTARIWDARTPKLEVQIPWAESAQFDPLSRAEKFKLGISASAAARHWPADGTKCDELAAAPYDPDRRAPGVILSRIESDTGVAACTEGRTARAIYQRGRALMAKGDVAGAGRDFGAARRGGYRSAQVDEAMLRTQPSGGMLDIPRAISLYERAWMDGVTIAAFQLGDLYEHGVRPARDNDDYLLAPNDARAMIWYQKAAAAGEPNALARLAEKNETAGFSAASSSLQNRLLLGAFRYYAAAAARAQSEDWPDDAWKRWRYRRASLARLLARRGLMQDVAVEYQRVRDQYAARPATSWLHLAAFPQNQ